MSTISSNQISFSTTPGVNLPTVTVDDVFTLYNTQKYLISVSQLYGNDTNPDNSILSITGIESGPSNGTLEYLTSYTLPSGAVLTGRYYLYTPDAGFVGEDTFVYQLIDVNPGADGGPDNHTTGNVTMVVNNNENPVAVDERLSIRTWNEPTTFSVSELLENDTDADGDSLTVLRVFGQSSGLLQLNADQTITVTPETDFQGYITFDYEIGDGKGGRSTATAEIYFTKNNHPVAADDVLPDMIQDNSITISVLDLLGNDQDEVVFLLSVLRVFDVQNGTVTLNDNDTITIVPDPGFEGLLQFSYEVGDRNGGRDTALVSVQVVPNSLPIAEDDTLTGVYVGGSRTFDVSELLGNDTDANGHSLEVLRVFGAQNGTVELNADQTITFTPDVGFEGTAQFEYEVDDGFGGRSSAVVTVPVSYKTIEGDKHRNVIYGSDLDEIIRTHGGGDEVHSGGGNDRIWLGSGNDEVFAGSGASQYHGGAGGDVINYRFSDLGVNVDLKHNTVSGGWADGDTISGFEGAMGSKTGNDVIRGTDSGNFISTLGGNDVAYDRGGADYVILGAGDDYLYAGSGSDRYVGSAGWDHIDFSLYRGAVKVDLAKQKATAANGDINRLRGFEAVTGTNNKSDELYGDQNTNTLIGLGGRDLLVGRGGDDLLNGGADDDKLIGGSGNDQLRGAAGQDRLIGNSGDDLLFGGAGADTFHFDKFGGDDVIRDFQDGKDRIEIDGFEMTKAKLMSFASVVGGDVVFDFGSRGTLTIEDASISEIRDDLFLV